jgi:hypothetical protein
MLRIVRFRQFRDANVDLDKRDLPTNDLVQAGCLLIKEANRFGHSIYFHYRIEDTTRLKRNGKPLVYFFADTTRVPTQYNHIYPDLTRFSSSMTEIEFIKYLGNMNSNIKKKQIVPEVKTESPLWYKYKFPQTSKDGG